MWETPLGGRPKSEGDAQVRAQRRCNKDQMGSKKMSWDVEIDNRKDDHDTILVFIIGQWQCINEAL